MLSELGTPWFVPSPFPSYCNVEGSPAIFHFPMLQLTMPLQAEVLGTSARIWPQGETRNSQHNPGRFGLFGVEDSIRIQSTTCSCDVWMWSKTGQRRGRRNVSRKERNHPSIHLMSSILRNRTLQLSNTGIVSNLFQFLGKIVFQNLYAPHLELEVNFWLNFREGFYWKFKFVAKIFVFLFHNIHVHLAFRNLSITKCYKYEHLIWLLMNRLGNLN